MDKSRTGKIGFQGAKGANSDIASADVFPNMEAVPCDTFEDVFNALKKGDVDLAMIPIENTLAGRVADIHHLLPKSGTFIIGEYFLPIHFDLMVLPGVKLEDIHTVFSHVHALGQCRNIIRKHGWKAIVSGDTAGSAKLVSESEDRTISALAPALAAEIYGLDTLAKNVEDEDHNTTRFVILSRDEVRAKQEDGPVVTTFLFQVRNIPAALYKAMGGFATNGVNMTKLESYQIGGSFSATQFYADIIGHPDDKNVQLALEELEFFCDELKILGVYPASESKNRR
ncbi:MAG: prephenate dehydratase [Rhizobiaceae bacterium]|nr:prephenate dehydratase [Rhizobiaceae bacterium]